MWIEFKRCEAEWSLLEVLKITNIVSLADVDIDADATDTITTTAIDLLC